MRKIDRVASRIIHKWLKKGNMARAMRDVLPRSGLSFEDRNEVARIVHDVVRFKRYYDFVMEKRGIKKEPQNYVALSRERPEMDAPRDIRYSLSPELAKLTPDVFIPIINREPDTTLCVNLSRISREEASALLKREGFSSRSCVPETCLVTEPAGRYASLIKNGLAMVQDPSSQLVAKITGSLGDEILDYCAGSGGKSLAMYALYPSKSYHAYDVNERKLHSLEKRAQEWGMNIMVHFEKPYGELDVVLVDAPCSGVGAAARNPEAKYQSDFEKFAGQQIAILNEAKSRVKEGGFLVYVVCSYISIETENVVQRFLEGNPEFSAEISYLKKWSQHLNLGEFGAYILLGDIFYISVLRR